MRWKGNYTVKEELEGVGDVVAVTQMRYGFGRATQVDGA